MTKEKKKVKDQEINQEKHVQFDQDKKVTKKELQLIEDNLLLRKNKFDETGNSIYAFEAFLWAYQAGLYPPVWCLDFIAGALAKYNYMSGTESLDKIIGLKKGPGQEPAFKAVFRDDVLSTLLPDLMTDMFRLNMLGYTLEDAAYMAHEKLMSPGMFVRKGHKIRLSVENIIDHYKREWHKKFKEPSIKNQNIEYLKNNEDEFLSTFPEHVRNTPPTKPKKV